MRRFSATTRPELPRHYVRRAPLLLRLDSALQRRLTVLHAPAGFGKTTVLADVSDRIRREGAVVGWLSLDEHHQPDVLESGIVRALENGGLDPGWRHALRGWSSSTAGRRMLLARAVERLKTPCLLVLDDVDRLPCGSAALVDRLVKRAPVNLHVVISFQSNPQVDFATHVLNGSGAFVGPGQFRFSPGEIGCYFGDGLSHRELAEVEERTVGWAFGLTLCRQFGVGGANRTSAAAARLSRKYVEGCLLRNVPSPIRADLLDLAVFERIEANLVDEVLGSSEARLRVVKQPELGGLLLPVEEGRALRQMQPMVRDYCVDRLATEDPARLQLLQARIDRAISRSGA